MFALDGISRRVVDVAERIGREVERTQEAVAPQHAPGRDSLVGEHRFAAGLVRFALGQSAAGAAARQPQPLSCPEIASLVRAHAPILVFNPGEENFPASPLEFIEHSELREHRRILWDRKLADRGEVEPSRLDTAGQDNYQFLDLDNDYRQTLGQRPDASGRGAAPIHYQLEQGPPLKVTYHVFYAYNDGPSVQNHEGDWERITIEFAESSRGGARGYEPARVHFSAHHGGSSVTWDEARKDASGRPLVFVARGSHANYPEPGNQPTAYDAHPSYTPRQIIPSPEDVLGQGVENLIDDETATDRNGDGRVDRGDGAFLFDVAQSPLLEVTGQSWYPEQGAGFHWGERGELSDTSGPQGPSAEKGHVG